MIPEVADKKLAFFCDVFCEEGYFTIKESEKILNIAKSFGLIPKIHADEFNYFGASKLAKDIGAISADHLMAINNEGIDAIVQAVTNLAKARVAMIAEQWLNKPVIAINTATYWHALRSNGIKDKVDGFGSLLSLH